MHMGEVFNEEEEFVKCCRGVVEVFERDKAEHWDELFSIEVRRFSKSFLLFSENQVRRTWQ